MQARTIDEPLYQSYSPDIPNFLKKIYASRGASESSLNLSLNHLLRPNFPQLNHAIVLLSEALKTQQRILIIGDFDCDGATASAVAVRALRLMGAKHADFLVPNRVTHGYGLSPEIVALAVREKQPELIITVDNGISSFDGVTLAKSLGIRVIITDHHLPSDSLPEADAIINPNLRDCSFASKHLAGVGVCFYLFSALKTHLQQHNYFVTHHIPTPDLRQVLDLVALGTVADVVRLDQNNRILIQFGIERMRAKRCAPGILALLEIARRDPQNVQASDLGFAIAPRLNAAGRLSDMSIGIRCLLSDDINDARRYARILEDFNRARKTEQDRIQTLANEIVQTQNTHSEPFAISVFDASWHEGVIGIVAGKLKEQYQCPCAVFAQSGEFLKASIRTIPSVHIKDLLDLLDRQFPDLILKFGGHAMAAGLSLSPDKFEAFRTHFAAAVARHLHNIKPTVALQHDGALEENDISLTNAKLLRACAPWGQGFDEPIFIGKFQLIEQKVVGEQHLKCRLKLISSTPSNPSRRVFDGIAFFQTPIKTRNATIAYRLSLNYWRGDVSLQLMIVQMDALID